MKLLILTQKVNRNDPILGFFHRWIEEFSKKFEKINVICLEKTARHASQGDAGGGEYDLPENVEVYSLGKSVQGGSTFGGKIKYVFNFCKYIWNLRKDYDSVFVHMNQEYVVLGWKFWKLWNKKIYMWRNHNMGNFFTKVAVFVSDKVFCTSKFAFVAKYKKTKFMPVGIDTDKFIKSESLKVDKVKNSILFLGRMDVIKRPDLLIKALDILNKKGIDFVCDFYGDPTPNTGDYFESLKKEVLESDLRNKINFYKPVPNHETPKIYNNHDIYVNLTPSGSFDKTILEAGACGCVLIVLNRSIEGKVDKNMIVEKDTPEALAEKIEFWLSKNENDLEVASKEIREYVIENHSLKLLAEKISEEINK